MGPGRLEDITLNPFRAGRRLQQLAFDMAADLTRAYVSQGSCEAPAHVFFPQLAQIVRRYLVEKVIPEAPAEAIDVLLSPYYGWVIERLAGAIHPDAASGEIPELPILEKNRGDGSTAEVSFCARSFIRT